ncbi:Uncharacterised protein [Legionella beliardensis]|uniref:Transmembrane protein n=1 Tax=Legionella beliardensis TaxID=91822 RepID=A0A378I0R6_9GAMM|nr:hypothetical protein [Legionella beliardensis]STX28341.1 Uncharacterised protein [Legionella beliardensis]
MKFIEHLEGLISSKIELAKGIWTLFKLEAKLAGLNIYPLFLNLALLPILLLTIWFSAMALVGYIVAVLSDYVWMGIVAILLLNAIILAIVVKRLITNARQMSFEKTRACFTSNKVRDAHELQKRTASADNQHELKSSEQPSAVGRT